MVRSREIAKYRTSPFLKWRRASFASKGKRWCIAAWEIAGMVEHTIRRIWVLVRNRGGAMARRRISFERSHIVRDVEAREKEWQGDVPTPEYGYLRAATHMGAYGDTGVANVQIGSDHRKLHHARDKNQVDCAVGRCVRRAMGNTWGVETSCMPHCEDHRANGRRRRRRSARDRASDGRRRVRAVGRRRC